MGKDDQLPNITLEGCYQIASKYVCPDSNNGTVVVETADGNPEDVQSIYIRRPNQETWTVYTPRGFEPFARFCQDPYYKKNAPICAKGTVMANIHFKEGELTRIANEQNQAISDLKVFLQKVSEGAYYIEDGDRSSKSLDGSGEFFVTFYDRDPVDGGRMLLRVDMLLILLDYPDGKRVGFNLDEQNNVFDMIVEALKKRYLRESSKD